MKSTEQNIAPERNFSELVGTICEINSEFSRQARQSVNISLTLRNWLFGYYIAEYELNGMDRAKYGSGLLEKLSERLREAKVSSCGKRQLYQYLSFFNLYPQIVQSLTAQFKLPLLPGEKVQSLTAQL